AMALTLPVVGGAILLLAPLGAPLKLALAAGLAATLGRSLLKLEQERRRASGEVGRFALIEMGQTGGGFVLGAGLAALGWGGAGPLAGSGMAAAVLL
ncbi:lipopolysaccharide biosynthesis protein, partial [Acinetobacter baumannii]